MILAEPVADTLKQVDEGGQVSGTVDRQSLWRAQTPQLFPLFALRAALGRCLEECSIQRFIGALLFQLPQECKWLQY